MFSNVEFFFWHWPSAWPAARSCLKVSFIDCWAEAASWPWPLTFSGPGGQESDLCSTETSNEQEIDCNDCNRWHWLLPGRLILVAVPGLSVRFTSILAPRELPLCCAHSLSQIITSLFCYYHITTLSWHINIIRYSLWVSDYCLMSSSGDSSCMTVSFKLWGLKHFGYKIILCLRLILLNAGLNLSNNHKTPYWSFSRHPVCVACVYYLNKSRRKFFFHLSFIFLFDNLQWK